MHARRLLTAAAVCGSVLVIDVVAGGLRLAEAQVAVGDSNGSEINAGATPATQPTPPPAPAPRSGSGAGRRTSGCASGGVSTCAPRRGPVRPRPPAQPPDVGEVKSQTQLPVPTVGLSPAPPIPQLVNLPVFLWIDPAQWVPVTASATSGGVTSTVTATPRRVVWDMGNGESVPCDGPGAAYVPGVPDDQQPSKCRYTYRRSSAGAPNGTFTVTTTLEWDVSWVAIGAPGGGPLDPASQSTTTTVEVVEVQALNVPVR